MKYIYNGIETTDEYLMDEIIFNELGKQNKFPSEYDVADEWSNVERVEEGK